MLTGCAGMKSTFLTKRRESPHFWSGLSSVFEKKVGEFLKIWIWKPHEIRAGESERLLYYKGVSLFHFFLKIPQVKLHYHFPLHVRFINFQLTFVSERTVSSARARIFHTRGTLPLRQATQRHIKSEKTRFKCRRTWSTPFMEYYWHLCTVNRPPASKR